MVDTTASGLYEGWVSHRRVAGPPHDFRYGLYLLLLDLDELPALDRRLRLFGRNRARPVSFHDRDHLGDPARPVRENVEAFLRANGVSPPAGPIRLATHARVFGYVFNPVSFYYCYDRAGDLSVAVAEVNNTFGERHPYLLPLRQGRYEWCKKKLMHVSPFFSMAGTYRFELPPPGDRLDASVDLTRGGETVLAVHMSLKRRPLNDRELLRALVHFPLMTAKVIGAIHWEALRLWLKRARVFHKPPYDPEAAGRELG